MATRTITLPNFRVGSDLTVKVRLKDGGVAIDWSTLSGIRAVLYSDAQSSIAGRCDVTVDGEDPTLLVCRYAATKMQYLGVNRIVVSAKYMGETKTYDKPVFTFVRWTADQEGEQITIEDPEVTVEISVEDISSSILQEAVDAAFSAADRANDAAEAAEHMVDIHTGPEGKSAYEVAVEEGYTGTEEEWLASLKGPVGETPNISIGTVTTVEPGTPAEATMTGTPEAPVLNLSIPKGLVGATPNFTIGTVTTGEPGTPVVATITGTAEDPVLNITIPQGAQGNTGSSVEYPFELVNNLTTDDATKALSAAQGVALDNKVSQLRQEVTADVSQLEAKVDDIATGKFYGYHSTVAYLPEGDVPGYAYVGTESPYAIYNYDGTTWTDSGATVKRGEGQIIYLEDFPGYASDLSPVAMREFLQSAIDYVGEKKAMLIFPKGQTFVIDIPETDIDIRYDCEGGDGLKIPSDITIDFNYSKIKADTNHWWCYNIIHIPVTTENATLMNGYIVGDRDTHIMSNTVSQNTRGTTDEWHYCIRVQGKGKDRLINMVCSDVRGDGISIEGECLFNHPIAISDSALNKGQTVDGSGALSADANYITTNLLTLDNYYTLEAHKAGLQTYLTPRTSIDRVANNVECSYELMISYYTDTDVFISSETIMMGYPMNIPQNASKFRITQWVADSSLSYGFWVMNTLWNELSLIQGCEVTRCGRNGILPTICNGLVIRQCKISKIFGTNNSVAIDIEGTSYVQRNIYIRDCLIDNPGYNGIIIVQGERIFVNNCVLNGCGISSSGNRTHIDGCKADDITIQLPVSTIYEIDLIYGKSTIRNCDILNNINAAYSIVENCVCTVCSTTSYYRDKKIVAPIFRGCKLQKVGESYSLYEDCEIMGEDTNAILLRTNEVDFVRCKIKVPRIIIGENAQSRFEGCEIVVTAPGNDVVAVQTDYFVNNHIITEGPNAANKFNIKPVGNVCVIKKNTYEGQFFFHGLILTNGYLSVAKIIAVRDNCFVSTQNGVGTFLQINAALKESMVFFERNVMSSAGNWTDIGIAGVAESDKLKIFTDSNTQIGGGTLAELADSHIYRATWTPSVTP